jgi:hypothetical protein
MAEWPTFAAVVILTAVLLAEGLRASGRVADSPHKSRLKCRTLSIIQPSSPLPAIIYLVADEGPYNSLGDHRGLGFGERENITPPGGGLGQALLPCLYALLP